MNLTAKPPEFEMRVSRESFVKACVFFRNSIRTKREREQDFVFVLEDGVFTVSWGDISIDISAEGVWPGPVSVPSTAFYAVVKYPPTADPLVFYIKDERLHCGGWSCQCLVDHPAPDLFARAGGKASASSSGKTKSKGPRSANAKTPSASTALATEPPAKTNGAKKHVLDILDDLENVRENLLAFSDDVWLDIDHNDTQAMESGVVFKKRLNEQIDTFGKLSGELKRLIEEYTQIQTDGEAATGTEVGDSSKENSRIIKELNRSEAHAVSEKFTYKRPCGFILDNIGYQGINTWQRVYELVLRQLAKKDPVKFKGLPDNPATFSVRDNRYFSRDPATLRKALALPDGVNAETNLSANNICGSIRNLLKIFDIPESAMAIFLRQDRNA